MRSALEASPANLYGLAVGPAAPSSLAWMGAVIDRAQLLGVGPHPVAGVAWVREPRDRGTLPAAVAGLIRLLSADPDALVVLAWGSEPLRARCLPALVRALASVVDDPDRCVTLASPSGRGGWITTHPGEPPDPYGVHPALTYRAPRAAAPAGALREVGVLVGEGAIVLRRLLAGAPTWSRGLLDAAATSRSPESLYRSLPTTSLEQALEADPSPLAVAPLICDDPLRPPQTRPPYPMAVA